MRKLIVSTFASLDGVMQAPGGPEEDPTGGFALGGWMFGFGDESIDISAAGFDGKDRELVLGRRTYQIFEAYWPYQPEDHPIAKTLNAARKHVASRTLTTLHWNNSTLLQGDVVSAISALKAQPGPALQMIGSGNLIQTLQAASLIDEYNVWTFPVVLGRGKRLFSETARPSALRLVRSTVSSTGVVMSTYAPSGDIQPGSFASAEPSERELARRKMIRKGALMADEIRIIATKEAPASVGPFSQGTRARGFIFVSGQGAFDPATGQLVSGGIKEQTRRVLRNIEAVLKAGGGGLDRIVKVTVFLSDWKYFKEMNEAYGEFFSSDLAPARSTVQGDRWPDGHLVAMEAIALEP